jgi:hypothetical protein
LPKTGAGAPKTGAFETYRHRHRHRRADTPKFHEIPANEGNSRMPEFDRNRDVTTSSCKSYRQMRVNASFPTVYIMY